MTRHQVMEHLAEMLPSVQTALCDADPAVREAAGAALGVLFRGGAGSAVDTVVPTLLTGLESPKQYDQSLEGLRVILNVRPQIFNGIVPKFLRQPVTRSSLMALGDLADVAGQNCCVLIYGTPSPCAWCACKCVTPCSHLGGC